MQHINPKWLKLFTYVLALTSAMFCAGYLLLNYFDASPQIFDKWGMELPLIILAVTHLLYSALIYRFIEKKSPWLASIISLSLYGFLLMAALELSQHSNPVFFGMLLIYIFFTAINGVFSVVSAIIFIWLFVFLTILNALNTTYIHTTERVIFSILLTVSCLIGWLVFKKYYISTQNAKNITTLSNMLEQEQFKSSIILESITDGVMIINMVGTVQVLNKSAANMLGWQHDQAINLDYKSLIQIVPEQNTAPNKPADEDQLNPIMRSFRTGKPEQGVCLINTQNKRQIYVDIVASPIKQDKKLPDSKVTTKQTVGVIAVLRDVDNQKRQEEQRSEFISTASHEMRTPVASIQGFIELALNPKVANVDEKAKEYLEKARTATKHLGKLFQDLLTASKSEDGRLITNPKIIDITAFLKEVTEQERSAAEAKGLQLVFDQPKNTGEEKVLIPLLYVYADPERLREVVFNLIDNAIKYTSSGIVTVGVSLNEKSVVIRVSDTGMGIAAEDIPHLFQKFYRTDNSATRLIGGTGLGLYISKQIVDMLHGKIWVESTVGAGSTFYVELPRISPEEVERIKRQTIEPVVAQKA